MPNRIRYCIMAYILNRGVIASKGTKIASSRGEENLSLFLKCKTQCINRVYWCYYNFTGDGDN